MIKRPLTILLAALALGIICRDRGIALIVAVPLLYVLILLLLLKNLRFRALFRKTGAALLAPLFLLIGMLLGSRAAGDYDIDLCLAQTKSGKTQGSITGLICDISRSKSGYRVTLENINAKAEGGTFVQGKALVYLSEAGELKIGNRVSVKGTIREFGTAENPGQFDERAYYRAKGYSFKVYADSVTVTGPSFFPVREILRRLREKLSDVYDAVFPEDEAGIVKALVLGDKSTLSDDIRELYQKNGIAHILAISGLHVSMVGTGLYMALRRLKLPMLPCVAVTDLLMVFYGILTGFSVSTIRAVFMLLMRHAALLLGKSYDPGEACSLIGTAVLLFRPLLLFQASFMLSFAAVTGLGYFSREFAKWEKLEEKSLTAGVIKAALAGLAPQLATVPLIWFYYYEIPIYSLLINLLILPFMALLLGLCFASGAAGLLNMTLAVFPAGGAFALLKAYNALCALMLKLPDPLFLYGRPERIRMVLCYSLMMLFFVAAGVVSKRFGPKKRPYAAAVLLLIPLAFVRLPFKGVNVSFLSVGQGDCCVIQYSASNAVIIDCGSTSVTETAGYRLEPFLKYSGISTVDAVFLTHPDKDHYSGIEELFEDLDNGRFYTGTVRVKRFIATPCTMNSTKLSGLLECAGEKGVELISFLEGDSLKTGAVSFGCLYPGKEDDTADNAGSLVLLVKSGKYGILMMGDSGAKAENAVARAAEGGIVDLPVDILKVAHHGSNRSSSDAFIGLVKPKAAVLSYGRGNIYGHPGALAVERLQNADSLIFYTGKTGAACFRLK